MSHGSIPPEDGDVSRGSSASGKLQEEYEELLKHAAVVPRYDRDFLLQSVAKQRGEFLQQLLQQDEAQECATSSVSSISGSKTDSNLATSKTKKLSMKESNSISTGSLFSQPEHLQKQETFVKSTHYGRHRPMKPVRGSPKISFSQIEEAQSVSVSDISSEASSTGSESLENIISDSELPQTSKWDLKESTFAIQPELQRMGGLLDKWLLDLKRKILDELGGFHHNVSQHYQKQAKDQVQLVNEEVALLKAENQNQADLTETFKKSNQNKDQVIVHLSQSIQKEKRQQQAAKMFYKWKALGNENKKEIYASQLAQRHYTSVLKKKVFKAWKSIIEKNWKTRVEEACQNKAKEVCTNLSDEYEKTINELMDKLESSQQALLHLQREKDLDEENMKKAFLRGVCALNLETMSAFQGYSFKSLTGNSRQPPSDPGMSDPVMTIGDYSILYDRPSEESSTNLMEKSKKMSIRKESTGMQHMSSEITEDKPSEESLTNLMEKPKKMSIRRESTGMQYMSSDITEDKPSEKSLTNLMEKSKKMSIRKESTGMQHISSEITEDKPSEKSLTNLMEKSKKMSIRKESTGMQHISSEITEDKPSEKSLTNLMEKSKKMSIRKESTGMQHMPSEITEKPYSLGSQTVLNDRDVDSSMFDQVISDITKANLNDENSLRFSESVSHEIHPPSLQDIKLQSLNEVEINRTHSSLLKSDEESAIETVFKKPSSSVDNVPISKHSIVDFNKTSSKSSSKIIRSLETIDEQDVLLSPEELFSQIIENEQLLMTKSLSETLIKEIEISGGLSEIVPAQEIYNHHQDSLDSVHLLPKLNKHESVEIIDTDFNKTSKCIVNSSTLLPPNKDIFHVPVNKDAIVSITSGVDLDTMLSSKIDRSPIPEYIEDNGSRTYKSVTLLSSKMDIPSVHEELHSKFKDPQPTKHTSDRMELTIPISYSDEVSSEFTRFKNKEVISRSSSEDSSTSTFSPYCDLNLWTSEFILKKSNQFIPTTDSLVNNKSGKHAMYHSQNRWSSIDSDKMDSQRRYHQSMDYRIHTHSSEKLPWKQFEYNNGSQPKDKFSYNKQILSSTAVNQNRKMTMTKTSAEKKRGTKLSKLTTTAIDLTTSRSQHPVPCMNAFRLDPPMQSVVVERHVPVNKDTLGHSMASKYCRSPHLVVPAKSQKGILKNVKATYKLINVTSNNT